MNSLLIYPGELSSEGRVLLVGERARHAREDFHDVVPGVTVPAGIRGGNRGRATYEVIATDDERVELVFEQTHPPMARTPVRLIVAISRPQTIKKVVQASVFLGVRELFLVRTDRTEKSYLSSRELRSERISGEVDRALEQAGDSVPPRIEVGALLTEVVRAHRGGGRAFFADTAFHPHERSIGFPQAPAKVSMTAATKQDSASVGPEGDTVLLIGPEKGWSERELRLFGDCHLLPLSLGERVLRVDAAVYVATALLLMSGV